MQLDFTERFKKFTDREAKIEASRCLMCEDSPCMEACPASVDVKHFIRAIRFENPRRAINVIRKTNVLAGVCGTICPHEQLCVGACNNTEINIPIMIGELQRYAADVAISKNWGLELDEEIKENGKKVAVIGGGPAGLAAAAELRKRGYSVDIYEKREKLGGMVRYGIPSYRLDPYVLDKEIDFILDLGVKVKANASLGSDFTLDSLLGEGYNAVLIATGLWTAAKPGIPGEDLENVVLAIDFLDDVKSGKDTPYIGKNVVVIGGGSVAMDAACSALRKGAERVEVVCLEGPNEMPAFKKEIEQVLEEGVILHNKTKPLEIVGNEGQVIGFKGIAIEWIEPGNFIPSNAKEIPGTEFYLRADTVIIAIGQKPADDVKSAISSLENQNGYIKVDPETFQTSNPKVFAAGDIAIGCGRTVVKAVDDGRKAAIAIDNFLKNN